MVDIEPSLSSSELSDPCPPLAAFPLAGLTGRLTEGFLPPPFLRTCTSLSEFTILLLYHQPPSSDVRLLNKQGGDAMLGTPPLLPFPGKISR
jgi:hypothetical protein